LTQTPDSLLSGVRDQDFALSGSVALKNMWFTLHNSDNSKQSHHKIDVSFSPLSMWYPGTVGNNKDILLNFSEKAYTIDTATFKDLNGAASEVINDLDIPNYKIIVAIGAAGQGNTRTNGLEVNPTKFEMVGLIDSDGNVVPETDSKYADVKEVMDATTHDGFYNDVWTTNEDLSAGGIELDVRTVTSRYNTDYITPLKISNSILNGNDRRALQVITEYVNVQVEQRGIDAFDKFFDDLALNKGLGRLEQMSKGLGNAYNLIDPFYEAREISLYDTVDSDNTATLEDNVGAVIGNNIKQITNDMVTVSGILDAATTRNSGQAKLVIVTDRKIKEAIMKGEGLKYTGATVEIVGLDHEVLRNKVRFFITVPGAGEGTGELQWGFRSMSPTPVIEVTLSDGKKIFNGIILQPRTSFHNKLAIGAEITISDWDKIVSNKVSTAMLSL
jgi:hypothetical protein